MKMPVGPIDGGMFAPCGMNCLVCYRHCSHKRPCAGCLQSDTGKPEHCRICAIKDCVREQGVAVCGQCPGFPCKRLKKLEKSYQTRYGASLLANNRAVGEKGLPAFMEEQKAAFTCPACGGVISLHDKVCSECKRRVEP